jgi:transcriptional regulator with XRE-family HTH domain
MPNQEDFDEKMLDANGFGNRLLIAIQQSGINQSEFARRLGVSTGFTSEVVRGLKKPGADYLYGIKILLGVSIDWLLTGEGTMYGANKLDVELFRTIRLQIALARAAVIESDSEAKSLIALIRGNSSISSETASSSSAYLDQLSAQDIDLDLAVALYTTFLQSGSKHQDRRNLLDAAIAYFEANRHSGSFYRVSGNTSEKINIQANVGNNNINIMNNF